MPKTNVIFKELEILSKLSVPFGVDSEESKTVENLIGPPHLVPSYQSILESINLEPLTSLPWFSWVTAISSRLVEGSESLKDVASVNQLAALRGSVCKLMVCAIVPNLPCDLPYPSAVKPKYDITNKQKVSCVDLVIRVLLLVKDNDHLRASVMKFFGEMVCALFFLNQGRAGDADSEPARAFYQKTVTSLLDDTHQPTVFTHLMILLTAKSDGGRTARIARKILDNKLQRSGGVDSLLAATLMSDETPSSFQDVVKIANLLGASKRPDHFYTAVLPQVLELLNKDEVKGHQVAAQVAVFLQEHEPNRFEKYFLGPILFPLETPCDEGDIELTLKLMKSWVDAAPPQIDLSRPLPLICFLYVSLYETVVNLKQSLYELMKACFSKLSEPCPFALELLFPPDSGVYFVPTTDRSVVSLDAVEPVDYETASRLMMEFINRHDYVKVKCELYKCLLGLVVDTSTPVIKKMIGTEILSELSNERPVMDSLSERPQHLLDFLSNVFANDRCYDYEAVSLGLVLLTVFLQDNLIHRKSNWHAISRLEKPLHNLVRSEVPEIRSLAKEILNRLADHQIIEDRRPKKQTFSRSTPKTSLRNVEKEKKPEVIECSYDEAYQEAIDPHLPVRAHAMRTLAKLIRENDQKTMSNKSVLLALFKANLEHEDSYLYLSAVEGMSSLAAAFPDEVLVTLCKEYISRHGKSDERLKIGQVLMKTINIMGDVGAAYKDELMGALLVGVKDLDPLVRASSLSNIGEAAKVFSFRIHKYIIEVLHCVESIVDCDRAMEPRRASVMLVGLLIQGLGDDAVSVLGDLLPTMYRKLKYIYIHDRDERTKLHAQIALDHITHLMRGILFAKPSFSKTISIHDIHN